MDEVQEIKAELQKKEAAKAEKGEEEAYKKCTTIEGCKNYLKAYPNGKYAGVVNKKKMDMEKKEAEEAAKKKDAKPNVTKKQDENNNSNTKPAEKKKVTTKKESNKKEVKIKK